MRTSLSGCDVNLALDSPSITVLKGTAWGPIFGSLDILGFKIIEKRTNDLFGGNEAPESTIV